MQLLISIGWDLKYCLIINSFSTEVEKVINVSNAVQVCSSRGQTPTVKQVRDDAFTLKLKPLIWFLNSRPPSADATSFFPECKLNQHV